MKRLAFLFGDELEKGLIVKYYLPVPIFSYFFVFGETKYHNHALEAWLGENRPGWRIEVQARPPGSKGFTPVPKRWVVERTNAWNGRSRRNSKDYERKPESAAAMIQLSHLHLMLRQLAPAKQPEFRYDAAAYNDFQVSDY